MAKFKVGDKVRVIDQTGIPCWVGSVGVIKCIRTYVDRQEKEVTQYAVELDHTSDLHDDCGGCTKDKQGEWMSAQNIKLVRDKLEWIDAAKTLPDEKTIIENGLWFMVETYSCYPICMGDYNQNKYVFPACYNQHTKIWHVFYSDDRNVYVNALLHESDPADWNTIVTRWKPMPRRVEDEDEM